MAGWDRSGKRELSTRDAVRESAVDSGEKKCFRSATLSVPWENAFPATKSVIARAFRRRAASSGTRIVSSRHEPLVKNIRSGFKREKEKEHIIEEKRRKRTEGRQRRRENEIEEETTRATTRVFLHCIRSPYCEMQRESSRSAIRIASLPRRCASERASKRAEATRERESRGFSRKNICFSF